MNYPTFKEETPFKDIIGADCSEHQANQVMLPESEKDGGMGNFADEYVRSFSYDLCRAIEMDERSSISSIKENTHAV